MPDDEKKRMKYCNHCFKDGQYTEKELTLEKMKIKIDKRSKELGLNKFQAYVLKSNLENLDRWRKKFYWE